MDLHSPCHAVCDCLGAVSLVGLAVAAIWGAEFEHLTCSEAEISLRSIAKIEKTELSGLAWHQT